MLGTAPIIQMSTNGFTVIRYHCVSSLTLSVKVVHMQLCIVLYRAYYAECHSTAAYTLQMYT